MLSPGGRFGRDVPGLREMADALAARGNRVLLWDRPNCGESDVCFEGESESAMQADALAALLRHLDMAPAFLGGGSAGSRASLLCAARHPDVTAGLALWWMSGGVYGNLSLIGAYCLPNVKTAFEYGMAAVADMPIWAEVVERNPRNRQRFLDQDVDRFVATWERWALAYCPKETELTPGLSVAAAAAITTPVLVFRSGALDINHPAATADDLARAIPTAALVELPWGDREWIDRQEQRDWFSRWHELVPQLQAWADSVAAA